MTDATAPAAPSPPTGERRWFLGSQAWIRLTTAATGGAVAIVDHLVPPGARSPWHVHHAQDETFFVLDGSLTVIAGSERITLGPGESTFGPRGVPHGFRVEGDSPARLVLICTPGGGFDRFIAEASIPPAGEGFPPPAAPDVARLSELASRHGMTILGPLPD